MAARRNRTKPRLRKGGKDVSAAQSEALDQITEIMREHFENAILIAELDGDEAAPDQLTYRTSGRWIAAVGLCEYAKRELLVNP
jgi:hypothetical protein